MQAEPQPQVRPKQKRRWAQVPRQQPQTRGRLGAQQTCAWAKTTTCSAPCFSPSVRPWWPAHETRGGGEGCVRAQHSAQAPASCRVLPAPGRCPEPARLGGPPPRADVDRMQLRGVPPHVAWCRRESVCSTAGSTRPYCGNRLHRESCPAGGALRLYSHQPSWGPLSRVPSVHGQGGPPASWQPPDGRQVRHFGLVDS